MEELEESIVSWSLNADCCMEQLTQKLETLGVVEDGDYEKGRLCWIENNRWSCRYIVCNLCWRRFNHARGLTDAVCSDYLADGCATPHIPDAFVCQTETGPTEVFTTRWAALQYGNWLEVYAGVVFDVERISGQHDSTDVLAAIQAWHVHTRRVFDHEKILHELRAIEIYTSLLPAVETDPNIGYNSVATAGLADYVEGHGWWFNSVVWFTYEDQWHYIIRDHGEGDYELFCRLFKIAPESFIGGSYHRENPAFFDFDMGDKIFVDSRLLSLFNSSFQSDTLKTFQRYCRRSTRAVGAICLKDGYWVWLPQQDFESPGAFRKRLKAFRDKPRKVKKYHAGRITAYYQSIGESFMDFMTRVDSAPGVVEKQKKTVDRERKVVHGDWTS
jgi:hypothetical protein